MVSYEEGYLVGEYHVFNPKMKKNSLTKHVIFLGESFGDWNKF